LGINKVEILVGFGLTIKEPVSAKLGRNVPIQGFAAKIERDDNYPQKKEQSS